MIPATQWLQSDHSDPLELVKLFYPGYLAYLPKRIDPTAQAKEAPEERSTVTWDELAEMERQFEEDMETLFGQSSAL